MHIEPHPITHIIKQRVLVYVEGNSDTEFKAQQVFVKDTGVLLTILLAKVGFLSHRCTVASYRNSIAANIYIQKLSAQVSCLT